MLTPRRVAVYFHRDTQSQEIIYVGVSTEVRNQAQIPRRYPRAFNLSSKARQEDHSQYCSQNHITVSIEYEYDGLYGKREAHAKELELIHTIRPRFNRCGKVVRP